MALKDDKLDVPPPRKVNDDMIPYVVVADEIFAIKPWLMKPCGGKGLPQEEEIFNYRLSRCRRTIENTFGILVARWRIFRRPIRAKPETVDLITKACLCLHNYLRLTSNACYMPAGFVDSEDGNGDIISGDCRRMSDGASALLSVARNRAHNRSSSNSYRVRDNFNKYFNSKEGSLPWQVKYVTRTKI